VSGIPVNKLSTNYNKTNKQTKKQQQKTKQTTTRKQNVNKFVLFV